MMQHITVGVANHSDSVLTQPLRSHTVILFLFRVRIAVYLDHELKFCTVEIHDVAVEGFLASEFQVFEFSVPENFVPHFFLGRCRIFPVGPGFIYEFFVVGYVWRFHFEPPVVPLIRGTCWNSLWFSFLRGHVGNICRPYYQGDMLGDLWDSFLKHDNYNYLIRESQDENGLPEVFNISNPAGDHAPAARSSLCRPDFLVSRAFLLNSSRRLVLIPKLREKDLHHREQENYWLGFTSFNPAYALKPPEGSKHSGG